VQIASLWVDDDIHGGEDWWQMILTEMAFISGSFYSLYSIRKDTT
jgi:hypothetical protein